VTVTDEASLYRAADTLLAAGLQRVFISLGVDGVLAADRERKIHCTTSPRVWSTTTGCGDASMSCRPPAAVRPYGGRTVVRPTADGRRPVRPSRPVRTRRTDVR